MNELSSETSPYLLQHASNPVHWKAWNEATLAKAKESNKLIILSSGYSACHWCHVMEHQSFEHDDVAAAMNRSYISIKVDREERPDVDAVYMKAVQLMTSHGGWPMNVICLPDGRPVWGGTYFPKDEWINALEQLGEMYQSDPQKMIEYAEKLHQGLDSISLVPKTESENGLSQELLKPLVKKWMKSFDHEYGGYARAPKFMMPNNYKFLLRYGHETNNPKLVDHVNLTLTKMAYGGLFDTVDGGFSRYSVDMKWHVPHFEKMLYDNGQLLSLYADAYKLTKNPLYKQVIEKTITFTNRELSNGKGAFYSALDADSLDLNGHLEEGAFYVWEKEELEKLIGTDFDLFSTVFNINEFGYWEKGNYVLIQNKDLEKIAKSYKVDLPLLQAKKTNWENILFSEREKRSKPRLDDKCLTSWNAIMCKGYIDAYKALGNQQYLDSALANAEFIVNTQWSADGNLFRNYKNGRSTINGFLEDYAHTIDAFIALYEATLDEKWLGHSRQLTDYCLSNFYEQTSGFFRFTSADDAKLVVPHYELEDNVIPASNSVMAGNLRRLGIYFDNQHYENICENMLKHVIPSIDYPSAFSNWLNVFLDFSGNAAEVAICSENAPEFAEKLNAQYLPNIMIAGTASQSTLPFLKNRFVENETLFYVCRNKACGLPEKDFDQLLSGILIKN